MVHRDPIRQGGDKEPHLIIQSATAFLRYPLLCYNHGSQTLRAKQTCGLAIWSSGSKLWSPCMEKGPNELVSDSDPTAWQNRGKQGQGDSESSHALGSVSITPEPGEKPKGWGFEPRGAHDGRWHWFLIRSQLANCIGDHSLWSLGTSWARWTWFPPT